LLYRYWRDASLHVERLRSEIDALQGLRRGNVHVPDPVAISVGLFDTVATAADLSAAMELIAWTNDRLVADRIDRLPQREWVYGVPNAGIVMAAFVE
jgi:hypothetical protein